ncbi:hypothetical protein BGX31_003316 [Mortierella sp. GBA43]|nr:hypothetical protein BGX31_003316 [Mortierella sp. GBA43]
MSRHSKNNTARGHFTYAEKQMLDYGTKKQRLGRDSMRDYDACYLCLQTARDPVCCSEGHLSCRECVLENIVAQKQEIERLAKMSELQKQQEEQEQQMKEELAQQILLNEFEKNQMGVLSKTKSVRGKLTNDTVIPDSSSPASSNGSSENSKKRQFEFDAAEVERLSKKERVDVAKAIEEEARISFKEGRFKSKSEVKPATKSHPVCTASDTEHKLSLKQLITVRFETSVEDYDDPDAKNTKRWSICPICRKGFTNTTKISILKSCGHVFCDNCCKQFVKKEGRCQTCDHKTKEKDIILMKGEGSGFSGGGAKEATRFDVAFQ